jgi:hypothetical protein
VQSLHRKQGDKDCACKPRGFRGVIGRRLNRRQAAATTTASSAYKEVLI